MPFENSVLPAEREREEQIRSVACPVCKAKRGKQCEKRNKLGHRLLLEMSHYGRLKRWEAKR